MPYTEKQRRAAFAELHRRMTGGKSQDFKGMTNQKLLEYAKSPLEKARRKK